MISTDIQCIVPPFIKDKSGFLKILYFTIVYCLMCIILSSLII